REDAREGGHGARDAAVAHGKPPGVWPAERAWAIVPARRAGRCGESSDGRRRPGRAAFGRRPGCIQGCGGHAGCGDVVDPPRSRLVAPGDRSCGVPERVEARRMVATVRGATNCRRVMVRGAIAVRDTGWSAAGRFRALVAIEAEVAELEPECVAGHAERCGGARLVAAVEAERLLDAAPFLLFGAVERVAAAGEVERRTRLAGAVGRWWGGRVGGAGLVCHRGMGERRGRAGDGGGEVG